ncbi:alpha/beta hydrolase [Amycolatopsis sp. NPDC021455]|uniref:alpha/beta fold hydrolase n=1 Tax=Amycolatopsis sp. NPDC021455 TaxID=3154901 RepID=UPI0033D0C082
MAKITTARGQDVHFVDHGGTGPALVLLHSFLMDESMFAPQVLRFSPTHRCITIDERGHGGTPAEAGFTYWDVAEDVIAVLDHLGIEQAVFSGTSQGGFIALRIALLAPERVRALAVLGSSGEREDPEVADSYRRIAAAWREHGPVDQLLDAVASLCLGEFDAEEWKAKWRKVSGDHLTTILDTLVDRDDLTARLPEIHVPALVLHGDADAAYPLAKARLIAERLPNAELVVVPGGAHFLSLTDPDAVNESLARFLSQN